MSYEESNIPDSVETGGGAKGWRIADGHFCRGREEDNNLETQDKIFGRLKRVGIHEGELDDGRQYAKLEVDLETRNGIESIGATLLSATAGKPSYTQCFQLGGIVLASALNQLIQLETNQATQKNRFGKYQTFLNGYFVDAVTLKPTYIKLEKKELKSEVEMRAYLDSLIEEIKTHPAYAERPKRQSDDEDDAAPTPEPKKKGKKNKGDLIADLEVLVLDKGWPTIDQGREGYIAMAKALAEKQRMENGFAALSDCPELILEQLIEGTTRATKLPKTLEPYVGQGADIFA